MTGPKDELEAVREQHDAAGDDEGVVGEVQEPGEQGSDDDEAERRDRRGRDGPHGDSSRDGHLGIVDRGEVVDEHLDGTHPDEHHEGQFGQRRRQAPDPGLAPMVVGAAAASSIGVRRSTSRWRR